MTVRSPFWVETDIKVCCSRPLPSGSVITVPVTVVIVLTSKPADTFSPLAESVVSFPQKADDSLFQKLMTAMMDMTICRFIGRFLISVTRQGYLTLPGFIQIFTGLRPVQ
jgi:hypothetical protein